MSQLHARLGVHRENADSSPTARSPAYDDGNLKLEMIGPHLLSRMEERLDTRCIWVDSCEIRSLVPVAMRARERQVTVFVAPAMLNRDDVLDLVRDEGLIVLKCTAVLAPAFGPRTNKATSGRIDHGVCCRFRTERAFA